MTFSSQDRRILRDLATRVAEVADHPRMPVRRRRWIAHNSLRSTYPMMLVFPEGSWGELLPETCLQCVDPRAREIEYAFRIRLYTFEHFQDDTVIEKEWVVQRRIRYTGWGLEPRRVPSPAVRGAWHFDPVIRVPADLKKLKYPEVILDEAESRRDLMSVQDLFGDILAVRSVGLQHLSYHLMAEYTALRGLEEVMLDMYSEPGMLHDAMAFLEEGHRRLLRQYIELGLLSFNNNNAYQNSGGNGYTDELPLPDADPDRVRPCDMWASAEAQEMAQVSPEHHAEFILAYEKRLLAPFGLTGYGCCEDLTRKLDIVFGIPRIRRISISPWSDVARCAAKLKGGYIFSWKPNPAHLVGEFNAQAVRSYIRQTLDATRACGSVLEMVLKDTHTCEQHPERFDHWTRIGRELIQEMWGELSAGG